ncbi:hypothetical protein BC629DRAFT_1559483 [Irpex lacteus]|nr:hypothetical protein BC629DRAFT_1559483 [Irpex lacteus]
MDTKQGQLRRRSMAEEKTSQERAEPAAKAANRSSVPSELATPMVNNAKARY